MITSRMMIAIGREKKYGMSPPFGAAYDQGSAEVGFQNIGKDNAENQRGRFKSVDFHKVSDETEHEHDDNFVHAVTSVHKYRCRIMQR